MNKQTSFVYNAADIKALLAGPQGPVFNYLKVKAEQVKNVAVTKCPVGVSGDLMKSIQWTLKLEGNTPTAYVAANTKYAMFVHEGTGIYGPTKQVIRPKTAKALRWPAINNSGKGRVRYKGGKTAAYIYAKSVKGSPGRPFLTDALKQVFPGSV